ncbi:ORF1a [Cordyline virus 1]|uniref:ORF1a n=1 Tax=Cordyline virus 1 TaxID=937809 RepID=E7CT62_9CLOS|nr:ORF1a [Cordyline virus 1]ADU03654.1 ORF1a [Cordyline virus 1]
MAFRSSPLIKRKQTKQTNHNQTSLNHRKRVKKMKNLRKTKEYKISKINNKITSITSALIEQRRRVYIHEDTPLFDPPKSDKDWEIFSRFNMVHYTDMGHNFSFVGDEHYYVIMPPATDGHYVNNVTTVNDSTLKVLKFRKARQCFSLKAVLNRIGLELTKPQIKYLKKNLAVKLGYSHCSLKFLPKNVVYTYKRHTDNHILNLCAQGRNDNKVQCGRTYLGAGAHKATNLKINFMYNHQAEYKDNEDATMADVRFLNTIKGITKCSLIVKLTHRFRKDNSYLGLSINAHYPAVGQTHKALDLEYLFYNPTTPIQTLTTKFVLAGLGYNDHTAWFWNYYPSKRFFFAKGEYNALREVLDKTTRITQTTLKSTKVAHNEGTTKAVATKNPPVVKEVPKIKTSATVQNRADTNRPKVKPAVVVNTTIPTNKPTPIAITKVDKPSFIQFGSLPSTHSFAVKEQAVKQPAQKPKPQSKPTSVNSTAQLVKPPLAKEQPKVAQKGWVNVTRRKVVTQPQPQKVEPVKKVEQQPVRDGVELFKTKQGMLFKTFRSGGKIVKFVFRLSDESEYTILNDNDAARKMYNLTIKNKAFYIHPECKVYNGRPFAFYKDAFCWVKAFASQNKKIPNNLQFMPMIRVSVLISFGLSPVFLNNVVITGKSLLHFDMKVKNTKHINCHNYFLGAETTTIPNADSHENYDVVLDNMLKKIFDKCSAKSDNATLNNILSRCSQKLNCWFDRTPNLSLSVCLSVKQKKFFSELFPELKIDYLDKTFSSHALFTAVREASNYTYFKEMEFKNFLDIGGNLFTHVRAGTTDVHICTPCVDVRDSKRHMDVALSLDRKLGEFDSYDICTNKAQDCHVSYDRAIAVEVYDMSLADMADAMIAHDCKRLNFSLLLPGELLEDFSTIYLFDQSCKITKDGGVVSYYYGNSAESYDHSLEKLRDIMINQVVIRSGKIFKKTLEKSRGPFRYYPLVLCSTMPSGIQKFKSLYDCYQSNKVIVKVPISDINGRITTQEIMINKSFVVNMVEYAANCVDNFNRKGFEYVMSHYRSRKSYVIYNGQVMNEAVNIDLKYLPGLLAVMLSEGLRMAERTNYLARLVYYQYYAPTLLRCVLQGLSKLFFKVKNYCYQYTLETMRYLFGDWVVEAYKSSGSQIRYVSECIEVYQTIELNTSGTFVDILDTTFERSVKDCGDMADVLKDNFPEMKDDDDLVNEALFSGGGKLTKTNALYFLYIKMVNFLCFKVKMFNVNNRHHIERILKFSSKILDFFSIVYQVTIADPMWKVSNNLAIFFKKCVDAIRGGIRGVTNFIFDEVVSRGFTLFKNTLKQCRDYILDTIMRVGLKVIMSRFDPISELDECVNILDDVKVNSNEKTTVINNMDDFDDITHILNDIDELMTSGGGRRNIKVFQLIQETLKFFRDCLLKSLTKFAKALAKYVYLCVKAAVASLTSFLKSPFDRLSDLKNVINVEDELRFSLKDDSSDESSTSDDESQQSEGILTRHERLCIFLATEKLEPSGSRLLRMLRKFLSIARKFLPNCFMKTIEEILALVETNLIILRFEKSELQNGIDKSHCKIVLYLLKLKNAVVMMFKTGKVCFETLFIVFNKLVNILFRNFVKYFSKPELKQILFNNTFELAITGVSAISLAVLGFNINVVRIIAIPPVYFLTKRAFAWFYKTEEPPIPMIYTTMMGAGLSTSLPSALISAATVMVCKSRMVESCGRMNVFKDQSREFVARHSLYNHARFINSIFLNRWITCFVFIVVYSFSSSLQLTFSVMVLVIASKYYNAFMERAISLANLSIALNEDVRNLSFTSGLRKKVRTLTMQKFKNSNISNKNQGDLNVQRETEKKIESSTALKPEDFKSGKANSHVKLSEIEEEIPSNDNYDNARTSSNETTNQLYQKNKMVSYEASVNIINKTKVCRDLLTYPNSSNFDFIQTSDFLVNALREYIFLEKKNLMLNIKKLERVCDIYRSGTVKQKDIATLVDDRAVYMYQPSGLWFCLSNKIVKPLSEVKFFITADAEIKNSQKDIREGCFTTDDFSIGYTNNRLFALEGEHLDKTYLSSDILSKITLINKPPGSGKTRAIVNTMVKLIDNKQSVLALSVTRVGKDEIVEKSRAHGINRTDCVNTVDGFIMRNVKYCVSKLLIDECFMAHCGSIVHILKNVTFDSCDMYGDINQIPYICRIPHINVEYSKTLFEMVSVEHDNSTYRCPLDVCYTLSQITDAMGRKIYKGGVYSKLNTKVRSMNCVGIHAFEEIPFKNGDIVMTFTQNEKNEIEKFNKTLFVKTINEIQGATYKDVKLVRSKVYADEIYDNVNQIVTAISRHTDSLTYYTPYSCLNDKVSTMIKDTRNVNDFIISQFYFKQRV